MTKSTDVDQLIERVLTLDSIKTWSLIITLFGDLETASLSGKQLRQFLSCLGIKHEAIRVALHRLKKDGWIDTAKSGREVTYGLSTKACRETRAVYDQIYGQQPPYGKGWTLALTKDTDWITQSTEALIRLDRSLILLPTTLYEQQKAERPTSTDSLMRLHIAEPTIPDWFVQKLVPENKLRLADDLVACIKTYERLQAEADSFQVSLLRLLILHHWRKMALRPATWGHMALLPSGPLASCHLHVTSFLVNTCVVSGIVDKA